ncbi:hypothetical protein HPB48_008210 [Haemaphysalis longicornis]|uniref:Uncharacterized protein n=1 Tax=Haemaphysalis longicornis TaxID=44386 RepID=A0A9J6H2Q4_HAELO|nr:hypothetical protein HPB48_008210 [Haemaphysalis longicornis]
MFLNRRPLYIAPQQMDNFPVQDMTRIMSDEYNSDSHPLSVDNNFPTELDSLFDRIVYQKVKAALSETSTATLSSLAVFYIMLGVLGCRQLHFAIQAQPEGPNTVNVKEVMDTWTKQAGYPVIDVVRNNEERTASITQRHHSVRPDQ